MRYEYKTVPAPGALDIRKEAEAEAAIRSFADFLNEEACDGWEFYCSDSIMTSRATGLFKGGERQETIYKMLIFRRPAV